MQYSLVTFESIMIMIVITVNAAKLNIERNYLFTSENWIKYCDNYG